MSLKNVLKKNGLITPADLGLSEKLLGKAPFLLSKAAQKSREAFEESLGPLGLTPKHYGVLTALEEKDSISQHEIGRSICIDRTTMVQILDDLERLGYVERKEHPTDRRSHAVYLNAKGKEALHKAHHLGALVEKHILESLSAKEQKALLQLLRRLVVALYSKNEKKGTTE
jgi:DNA-binding MarR family transcriptional regulator